MSKKVKSLLLVLCALVFAVAGVFATLAYLQDGDEVENTVTIGDIEIVMDEGTYGGIDKYDGTVTFDFDTRRQDNEYHLIPGVTYPKDPTIHIAVKSEPAYVFVKVENQLKDLEVAAAEDAVNGLPAGTIYDQMIANGWVEVDATAYPGLWVYAGDKCVDGKANIVDAKQDAVDLQVFGQFKVNPTADNEGNPDLNDFADAKINVKALAIQTVGFNGDYHNALPQIPASWGYTFQ